MVLQWTTTRESYENEKYISGRFPDGPPAKNTKKSPRINTRKAASRESRRESIQESRLAKKSTRRNTRNTKTCASTSSLKRASSPMTDMSQAWSGGTSPEPQLILQPLANELSHHAKEQKHHELGNHAPQQESHFYVCMLWADIAASSQQPATGNQPDNNHQPTARQQPSATSPQPANS